MYSFLYGILTCLCATAVLFFIRYWALARDRFFVFFAVAFVALGANWALLVGRHARDEYTVYFYLLRLFAFVLILAGIIDKNRRSAAD